MDCIFCKIANGEIPSKKAYEDERILAFYDLEGFLYDSIKSTWVFHEYYK